MDKKKQGKKNRAAGAAFELRVRKDLESQGWIVDKWSNNVEHVIKFDKYNLNRRSDGRIEWVCEHGVGHTIQAPASMGSAGLVHGCDGCCAKLKEMNLVPAKRKYLGPGRPVAIGTGFPDFIAFNPRIQYLLRGLYIWTRRRERVELHLKQCFVLFISSC